MNNQKPLVNNSKLSNPPKTKSLCRIGLVFVFLLLFSGCAGAVREVVRVEVLTPPTVLMMETPMPEIRGETNGDLMRWALELRAALRMANTDKAAARAWVKTVKEDFDMGKSE